MFPSGDGRRVFGASSPPSEVAQLRRQLSRRMCACLGAFRRSTDNAPPLRRVEGVEFKLPSIRDEARHHQWRAPVPLLQKVANRSGSGGRRGAEIGKTSCRRATARWPLPDEVGHAQGQSSHMSGLIALWLGRSPSPMSREVQRNWRLLGPQLSWANLGSNRLRA